MATYYDILTERLLIVCDLLRDVFRVGITY